MKYGDDVRIIGVAGKDDLEAIEAFVTNLGVDQFTHAIDENGDVWAEYGVRSQPAFAFINDDGTIETTGRQGEDGLNERINDLIAS